MFTLFYKLGTTRALDDTGLRKTAGPPSAGVKANKDYEYYYHGSPIQGLKELKPEMAKFKVPGGSTKTHVFLADSPQYAASYGLKRAGQGQIFSTETDRITKKTTHKLRYSPEQAQYLDAPMSLYKVYWKMPDGKFLAGDEGSLHDELAVSHPVPVAEEKKFKSVREALHYFDITPSMIAKPVGTSAVLKIAEFAPGIPAARSIDPLPTVNKSQTWQLAIQRHHADRAGEHLDLRLIDPKTNKAHSWAIPKAQMPAPGKSVLAVQQPTHTSEYATTFGKSKPEKITAGYGKGTVSLEHLSDIDLYHATPDLEGTRVRFNIYKGTHPEEYAIVRTSSGADILVNKTLSRERVTHLPLGSKPTLRETALHKIDTAVPSEVLMPKLDGAHTILDFPTAGRIPRLFSYRVGRRATTGVIEHTHKAPSLLELRVPKDLAGTILRAETIAVNRDTGKALPAPTLAGLLNSSVTNSREQQKTLNAELKPILFDIIKYKGRDVSDKSFTQRYTLLKDIAAQTKLDIVDVATTQKEKDSLLNSIKNQKHLLTTEGVILQRHQGSSSATKAKLRPDHDVYVRNIFEATDATGASKKRAGGFTYSWTPKGPITGRVGTGFDHAEAAAMLASPKDYVGRVAKVEAETKYPSGKLGKPAFKEWHLDKGKPFIRTKNRG